MDLRAFLHSLTLAALLAAGMAPAAVAQGQVATVEEATDTAAGAAMAEGEVRTALELWNRIGHPVVDEVLHNHYPNFGHWTVRKALAFERGDTLHYRQWRTTELRLFETGLFTNVGLDVEPAPRSGYDNIHIRTTIRETTRNDVVFGLVKGLPLRTTYLDVWNPGQSGLSFNSMYRWDPARRRAGLLVTAPIPVPGMLFAEIAGVWQSERWDISRQALAPLASGLFTDKSTGGRLLLKYIPDYRVEIGGGVEYRNRAAAGAIPALFVDSSNSGKLLGEVTIRIAESQRYRNRIHVEGFLARRRVLGDLDYSGGVAVLGSRWRSKSKPRVAAVWTLTAGTSRGEVPIDDYFVLGVETHPRFLLRGHPVAREGVSGASPMGSAFLLANSAVEGEIAKLPTFNAANLAFLNVKAEFFVDVAKTFDRARIFRQDRIFVDVGAGLQLATPTHALHLIFGQSATDGRRAVTAYLEKFW